MSERVLLVGAGNMATAIACSLKEAGNPPVAVWSRTLESAALLGGRVECAFTDNLALLPAADIVIISVTDNALCDVAAAVAYCGQHTDRCPVRGRSHALWCALSHADGEQEQPCITQEYNDLH